MRIKTITCHDVYNYGASLQAYALMKYLSSLGHDVEIIDYKPDYLSYNLWAIGERWNKNLPLRLLFFLYVVPQRLLQARRRGNFDRFTKDYLRITSQRYSNNEELKKDIPMAELYFAGSDQIWNTDSKNGRDPAFYLDFAPKSAIVASYAASFSTSHINSDYFSFVKEKLQKFNFISVRESTGLEILQSLGIENGVHVLDPVFLLKKEQWSELATTKSKDKYVLVYDQENNASIKSAALYLAKKRNLKIYAFKGLYPKRYADRKVVDSGPKEFLELIKNCEVLLTNSFHGTAFSILFEKEFYVFKREHEKVNSRMVDLLNMFDLNDRLVDKEITFSESDAIDYGILLLKIDNVRRTSYDYIHTVLTKRGR